MTRRKLFPVLILAGFCAGLLSMDIFLPSLSNMAYDFGVSTHVIQSSIWVSLLSSLVISIIVGPLSDHYGRKPILKIGVVFFFVGNSVCAIAPDMSTFLLGRIFQGIGAAIPFAVGIAGIQDLYDQKQGAKILAVLGALMALIPAAAPVLGGYIDSWYGWRMNFGLTAFLSLLLLIAFFTLLIETKPPVTTHKLKLWDSCKKSFALLKNKEFAFNLSLNPILCTGFWAYLTITPLYFVRVLEIPVNRYGYYVAFVSISLSLASYLASVLIPHLGLKKTSLLGIIISGLGSIALLGAYLFCPHNTYVITVCLAAYAVGYSMIFAPSTTLAVRMFKDAMGAASSLRNISYTVFATIGSFLGGIVSDMTLLPLSALFIFSFIVALGAFLYANKNLVDPIEES